MVYKGTLNATNPTFVFPFFVPHLTLVLQVDDYKNTLQFTLFPVAEEGYGEPHLSVIALGDVKISSSNNYIKKLTSEKVKTIVDSLDRTHPLKKEKKPMVGFAALNDDDDDRYLRVFICPVDEDTKTVNCTVVMKREAKLTGNTVFGLQVTDDEILVISAGRVKFFSLNVTVPEKEMTVEGGFIGMRKFKNFWFGLKNNILWILSPGEGLDKEHLSEKLYYRNFLDATYSNLEVTNNFISLEFVRKDQSAKGVRVLSVDGKDIFESAGYKAGDLAPNKEPKNLSKQIVTKN